MWAVHEVDDDDDGGCGGAEDGPRKAMNVDGAGKTGSSSAGGTWPGEGRPAEGRRRLSVLVTASLGGIESDVDFRRGRPRAEAGSPEPSNMSSRSPMTSSAS